MARSKIKAFKFMNRSVAAAKCPPGKPQALFRDTEQPALMLRVTAGGARSFIFEQRLAGKTVRVTIGPGSMQIRAARDRKGKPLTAGADVEAARLAGLVAQGKDPRIEKAATIAAQTEQRKAAQEVRARREVSGLDAWAVYCAERWKKWGARHYSDHMKMAAEGGEPRKRLPGKLTQPGPLRSLLARPLAEIDSRAVEQWVVRETKTRPARAALGFRLLAVFVNWCAEHAQYKAIVNANACKGRKTREKVAKPTRKADALQREQLKPWFTEVQKLSAVTSAYLQGLLLTGARREELASLRWADVDFRWGSLRIRDKVAGARVIPLTPHFAALLRELKARNETPPAPPRRLRADPEEAERARRKWKPAPWVFESRTAADGHLQEPRIAHNHAISAAGLPHLTLHGLRRSFGTLAEWVECPVGVVAQIQGHKPSAIAEKHYRVRPLDLLRMWHERIEAWILSEAGIEQPKVEGHGAVPVLRVLAGADARPTT